MPTLELNAITSNMQEQWMHTFLRNLSMYEQVLEVFFFLPHLPSLIFFSWGGFQRIKCDNEPEHHQAALFSWMQLDKRINSTGQ